MLFGIVYAVSGVAVEFMLGARDILLVYFFTTIGINASLKDLLAGGKPLLILLAITLTYMVIQNLTGGLGGKLVWRVGTRRVCWAARCR